MPRPGLLSRVANTRSDRARGDDVEHEPGLMILRDQSTGHGAISHY